MSKDELKLLRQVRLTDEQATVRDALVRGARIEIPLLLAYLRSHIGTMSPPVARAIAKEIEALAAGRPGNPGRLDIETIRLRFKAAARYETVYAELQTSPRNRKSSEAMSRSLRARTTVGRELGIDPSTVGRYRRWVGPVELKNR